MSKSKEELLKHYSTGDVHGFRQYDGFHIPGQGDSVMHPDKDGDFFMWTFTEDLRHSDSSLAVRIQIHKDTKYEDAVRILEKQLLYLKTWESFPMSKSGIRSSPVRENGEDK